MFAGFECPTCNTLLAWPQPALAHFSDVHQVVPPAALLAAITAPEDEARRGGDFLSPSLAGGCMREQALKRTEAVWVNPLKAWKMSEGTLWHEVMQKNAAPGWLPEVKLPEHFVPNGTYGPDVTTFPLDLMGQSANVRRRLGVWELELWPDVWLSGRADAIKDDFTVLHDYKSKDSPVGSKRKGETVARYNVGNWPASDDHVLQLNIYALMVKRLTGVRPTLAIWQLYKGIQDAALAWRLLPVPFVEEAELRASVEADFVRLRDVMRVEDAAKRRAAIGWMPLQGRTMFGGKKCSMYCGVKAACDAMLPVEERW